MPFIVQCPHADCKKYMLLEDSARGGRVDCLICKRRIQVDPSGANGHREEPLPQPEETDLSDVLEQEALRAAQQKIANCPQCSGPMRVPPGGEGKRIQCPHCRHVFTL